MLGGNATVYVHVGKWKQIIKNFFNLFKNSTDFIHIIIYRIIQPQVSLKPESDQIDYDIRPTPNQSLYHIHWILQLFETVDIMGKQATCYIRSCM